MKVLLINGGPHKDGCTNRALEEVSTSLKEEGIDTDILWIGNKGINGCIGCRTCMNNGKCFMDDIVNEVASKMNDYDGFVFGTPVHYAGVSGNMKSFMDRLFYSISCSGNAKSIKLKPAACVVSARRGGTTCTYDDMNKYFGISQMPIISTRYWNMVHGNSKEDVEKDLEGLQAMRILGRNMAYFLKCIECGKEKGIELPKTEKTILTNFIRD